MLIPHRHEDPLPTGFDAPSFSGQTTLGSLASGTRLRDDNRNVRRAGYPIEEPGITSASRFPRLIHEESC